MFASMRVGSSDRVETVGVESKLKEDSTILVVKDRVRQSLPLQRASVAVVAVVSTEGEAVE